MVYVRLVGDEFGQICDDDIRSRPPQLVGLPGAIHSDHQSEVSRTACFDAGSGILDHHRSCRIDPQAARRLEERVRGRLAGQTELDRRVAVHLSIEQVGDAGCTQYGVTVSAGGDHGCAEAHFSQFPEPCHRTREDLDPFGIQGLFDKLLLAAANALDRPFGRWRIRCARRQVDPPRGEKVAHPLLPRLPVDRSRVVFGDRETGGVHTVPCVPAVEELVEGALPRGRVHARGGGEYAVHVEQDGVESVWSDRRVCRFSAYRTASHDHLSREGSER